LPVPLQGWDEYDEETAKDFSKQVTLNKPYLGIYCHWSGYPSDVGKVLKEKFSKYEDILNLLVGGDCSFICSDGVRHYANRTSEEWKWIKPKKADSPSEIAEHTDHEYAYLFEDGEWTMRHCDEEEFKAYTDED
jgi:hypothetical protein